MICANNQDIGKYRIFFVKNYVKFLTNSKFCPKSAKNI